MTAPLVQRLSLVVDATTGQADSRLDATATAARNMGTDVERASQQAAAAAERLAVAQEKRREAAARVELAERKLSEVSDRYAADSSQVLAAEQRLETSRRQLAVATRNVDQATEQQTAAMREAEDAARRLDNQQERLGDSSNRMSEGWKTAGKALLAGGLVTGLQSFAEAAAESAQIGARTENVIRTTGMAAGVSADQVGDLAGAIAEKTGVDDEAIQSGENLLLTFTNVKNAAGEGNDIFNQATQLMTDLSAAMGTDTSAAAVQLGKALNDPIRGVSALSKVGVSFTAEQKEQIRTLVESGNVMGAQKIILAELSKEFGGAAEAMATPLDRAKVAVGNVAEAIGGLLLPAVGVGADAVTGLSSVVGGIPGPMLIAGAAAVGFGALSRSAAADGGLLSNAMGGIRDRAATFGAAVSEASTGTGRLATGMGAARVAGGGLLSALGGPLGVAVIGLGVGFTVLNNLVGSNSDQAKAAASANEDLATALKESNGVITDSVRQQAATSAQQAGILETARRVGVAQGDVTSALLGNEAAYQRVTAAFEEYQTANSRENNYGTTQLNSAGEAAADAQGEFENLRGTVTENVTAQQELSSELQQTTDLQDVATAATEALTEALQDGNTTTEELTRLAGEAAAAQDAAASANNRSQAAIDAYRDSTSRAVTATLELINARYSAENAGFAFLQAMDAAAKATDDATTSVDEQRQAQVNLITAAISAAGAVADAAVQNAEATGQVVDDIAEANIRADAMLGDLRAKLDTPGLGEGARQEIQGIIDQLQTARDRGDIAAVLSLTGADQVEGELDDTTEDRDTTVNLESRGGPAVIRYIEDDVAKDRTSLIRLESRNGPAVDDYADSLTRERLAIIRVETRGGPDADRYLDNIAAERTAIINVQRRGTGAAPGGGTGGAVGAAGLYGAGGVTIQQLIVQPQVDGGGRLKAGQLAMTGREIVGAVREYERANGTGWRKGGRS